jgi:hypothetical protein
MRKAVAQVASKARGNNTTSSSKRNRDETASSSRSLSPSKRAISPPKRSNKEVSNVKSHTQMTPDEAALAAKNYRLAKELVRMLLIDAREGALSRFNWNEGLTMIICFLFSE